MSVKNLSIDQIRTDGGTQMRAELTQEVYMDYRDKWIAGVEFDPVDVFHDGSVYWLADGFHRFYGAREAKRKDLPCKVHSGTQRDAILFACGANASHGLRRTPADKQRSVRTLLDDAEWCKLSNGKIAESCHVTPQFVGEIRRQLETVSSSPAAKAADQPRVGRDGKKRRPPVKTPKLRSQSDEPQSVKQHDDDFDTGKLSGESKDALGNDAPKELRQAFELRNGFKEQRDKLTSIKSWITQNLKHPGAAILSGAQQRIVTDIDNADRELKFSMPHVVCIYCKNKSPKVANCNACKGTGWINESVYKAAPKGMR